MWVYDCVSVRLKGRCPNPNGREGERVINRPVNKQRVRESMLLPFIADCRVAAGTEEEQLVPSGKVPNHKHNLPEVRLLTLINKTELAHH